ncbi:TonB-linked SusC/RagA family outer membrane protein [Hymenobacter luteus]|uniref:TonB-linked SusC/RagA family outer membrane protein n=2 Tax=Hymenobacter TaxID=89966 RepID=A0A7W9T1J8_9BACT|nr:MULTISPECIES: TonB-dependent receptor [Hymenobacter]MBB4601660.1 TonB-linked SusC/RagA family outer membrane protein [Hymenobacter latericoloratus]MBB6059912.1 TonB-linked SusC/RagA family outer membrane protein [Hymenobacter luteus]
MKKPLPKMSRVTIPALLCCLPLQPVLAGASAASPATARFAPATLADITVSGRVVDEKGAGLPGVNVIVKGTTTGTQTDADGRFSLTAPDNGTLQISFVGYTSQEVPVSGRTSISISLAPDNRALSEVVVVGYLTENRQNVTSAVSSLDVKEATKAPVATATQALQGRLPGVVVTGSGGPGDAPIVNIRGIGTLGNAGSGPLYVIDGLWTDNIRDLNPNDIETLNILKDASSTAVYGSRGANGVVQITTKKGRAGTPAISFNGYRGVDQVYKRYNLTNASQWADRAVTAYRNAGLDPLNNGQNSLAGAVKGPGGAFNPNIDTDWQDEFFQTGTTEDYNLTFSGGSAGEKTATNFLISGEYFHQEGIAKGPDFKRYSLRLNSGLTRGRLKFQENVQLTHLDVTLLNGAPFIDILTIIPSIPVYDPANEGGFGTGSPILNTFATNPIGAQQLLRRTQSDNRLAGNISTDLTIFDFLTYRLNVAMDGHTYSNADAQKVGILRQNTRINTSSLNEFLGYDLFLLGENTLNFNKQFGDHSINVVGGYSEQSYRQHNVQAGAQGFTSSPQYYFELSAGPEKGVIGGSSFKYTKRSFFAQATYDFKNRYLLSVSGRRDGSSRFTPANRWGNFGAASIGWRISEEDFFKNSLPAVNNLKLRASYGSNGNDALAGIYGGSYLPYPVVGQNVNYVIGTGQTIVNGASQLALPSPDIRWEDRYTKNIGLDLSVLDNRLTLATDYYVSQTRNALAPVQVLTYLGHFGQALYQNAGDIENRGIELALGYHDTRSAFTYGADFTLTTVKNKITAVPVEGQVFEGGELLTRSALGTSLGEFFLIPFDGIFQSNDEVANYKNSKGQIIQPYASAGDVRYKDTNDDGVISNSDAVYAGKSIPNLVMGLNLTAAYKGFDLSVFFNSSSGNKIYNTARRDLESYVGPNNYNADVEPWTAENPSTTTPRLLQGGGLGNLGLAASSNSLFNTTRWLEDGSYIRLRNIQLGYTFPKTFTSKVPSLGSVRVYVTGRNVFTITDYTGYDPEVTGTGFFSRGVDFSAYPNVRSFTGGIQVNF